MLWSIVQQGDLEIAFQGSDDYERMRTLMHKYRDHPMDLTDASLVCLAEKRRVRDIITLDEREFRTYRMHGRQTFRLWPTT